MCVIAFSPKGVDIPTVEQIKNMWNTNPDGAGYAFVGKNGEVFYRKGFMTLESLLKELDKPEKFKNTNFAIHFRIGTSGENDAKTCHPFPVSADFGELRKVEGKANSVLFHNGIIGEGGLASPLSSDTQDFVIAMTPMLHKFNRSKTRDKLIEEIVKGNRILVLYKNNAFKMYGDWKKDGDIWVSNLNYKPSTYSGARYGYGYGYGYDYYDDDYYYDNYYDRMMREDNAEAWEDKLTPTQKKNTDEDKNLTELKEIADNIFAEIVTKQYMFVPVNEIEELKKYADNYTADTMEYAGWVFGYDVEQEVIWLEEDTYEEFDDDVKEDDEEGE